MPLAVFRFPLGLRMVEDWLAARGIIVSHETVRQWRANSASSCNPIRRSPSSMGDKWHLDESARDGGVKHVMRAVDQTVRLPTSWPTPTRQAGRKRLLRSMRRSRCDRPAS